MFAVADLDNGILDALHFAVEITFSFEDIILHLYVTENAMEEAEPHLLCGYAHTDVRQEHGHTHRFDESGLTRHIGPGEKEKMRARVQVNIIRYRRLQDHVVQLLCMYKRVCSVLKL